MSVHFTYTDGGTVRMEKQCAEVLRLLKKGTYETEAPAPKPEPAPTPKPTARKAKKAD